MSIDINNFTIKDTSGNTYPSENAFVSTGYMECGSNIYAYGQVSNWTNITSATVTNDAGFNICEYNDGGIQLNYPGIYEFTCNLCINSSNNANSAWNSLFMLSSDKTTPTNLNRQSSWPGYSKTPMGFYDTNTTSGPTYITQNMVGACRDGLAIGGYTSSYGLTEVQNMGQSNIKTYLYWVNPMKYNNSYGAYQHYFSFTATLTVLNSGEIFYPLLNGVNAPSNSYYYTTDKMPFMCKLLSTDPNTYT